MKKRLLFSFFSLFAIVSIAQETNVPDDNFENYLETHDANGNTVAVGDAASMGNGIANDNKVYTSRIASVTDLDISRLTISDATGIEGFAALQNFICFENSLMSIDLSQNSVIQTINLGRNNLQSLDISGNLMLTSLSCSRNEIESLDVSQNTVLTTLNCSNNQLNSLNTTNNVALKKLSCYSNPLGSLDVSQNILLEDLDCVENELTSLDVTQNLKLITLYVYENELISLDISQNPALTYLYTEYNQLTSLDVSQNPLLEEFACYSNQLTYLNLRNGNNANLDNGDFDITNNPSLTCVAVDDPAYAVANFTKKDVQTIYTTSCSQTYVPDDNFEAYLETHNSIGAVVAIGDPTSMGNGVANDDYVGTEQISNITFLNISNQGIADFTGIEGFITLEKFRAFDNTISSGSLDLTANVNLDEIVCSDMGLNNINISGLTSLEILRAGDNNLMAIDLSSNVALHTLNLDKNDFNSIDVSANIALVDLRMRENSLNALDVSNNTNLTRLYCGDNSIVTLNLVNNTLLETLSVSKNQFTVIDLSTLVNLDDLSIGDTPMLTALDVTNNIKLEIIEVNNTVFPTLNLSNHEKLEEVYTNNSAITSLNFSSSPDIEYIECQNGQLTSLNLKNGNNSNSIELYATGNSDLLCIQVDDASASYLSSWEKDSATAFGEDCNWTYVPDDNFEDYLETHDADRNIVALGDATSMGNGVANDNYVRTGAIENVTRLFIPLLGVTDFTGLENFIGLEELFCFNNTINTSLDLTSNVNLKILQCGDMGLTSINITGLTILEEVEVPRNNLTSIDFSTNIALKKIVLTTNTLSDLDISANILLEDVQIHETTLTSLDVSTNVNLTRILASLNQLTELNLENNLLLEDLSCGRNPLSSLNVSHLTNLKDLNLDETNLTSIDVSNNTNLLELSARRNDDLSYLNVKNGNNSSITEFEVDDSPNLTCIEVDDPSASYLSTWVKDATANFAIYCRFTSIPDDNFEAYLETHNEFGGVVALGSTNSLGNGIIDDNLVPTEKIENIQLLTPRGENIADFTGVEDFTSLIRLWIDNNTLTNTSLDLTNNTLLESVIAFNTGLLSINVTGLTVLESLDVQDNSLINIDITTNTSLEFLNVADNELTSLDVSNNDLTSLTVTNNRLGTIDVSHQANLTSLYCENSNITSLNIQNNPLLENLECGLNSINNLDVTHLSNLFYLSFSNTSIATIDLNNNTRLSRLVCDVTPLSSLDLSNQNTLDDLSCKNSLLEYLNLKSGNNNDLDTVDVTGNPSLTCISVDDPLAPVLVGWLKDTIASYAEYCRLTYVPDDIFEAFLESNGYGNGIANDDYVYTALVEVSEGIIFQNNEVADMTGIEDFRDMWYLICRNNPNLTHIDLSKNTKLTTLGLQNNNLTGLDLTNNILLDKASLSANPNLGNVNVTTLANITTLDLANTGISSVDISNNPILRVLQLNDNEFTTLDVSSYPSVIQVRIANNLLTSLNVANGNNTNFTALDATGNPNLTCIQVDDVTLSANDPGIWHKDATAAYALYCDLTYVADTNFENYLETHDVDGNVVSIGDALSMGNGIANDNQVATSKIETVITLNIASQNIADLTGIEAFRALESLNIDYNDLTELDLRSNANLKILDAVENDFTSLDLSAYTTLEEVNLRSNALTSLLVNNNPNIKKLSTGKNLLTTLDVTSCIQLEELAVHQNVLESLDVRNGNNNLITDFFVLYNPNLTCIQVDDASASYLSSWDKDDIASFSEDCVAPVITLTGDDPQEIEFGSGYTEQGATTDDGSGLVIDSADFVDAVGTYTIRYNATDASGNMATEVTRTVNVVDTTAPVITLTGANPQEIVIGNIYTELGANTDDGSVVVIDASSINTNQLGQYTVTYNAKDASGNMATEVTRTVNVVDATAPVITLLGDNPQVIELGSGYTELGAITNDGSAIVIDTTDFVDAVGSYTIYYNATDASGNVATQVTRTVNVVDNCPLVNLPPNNFTITTSSETCVNKDNGSIAISTITDLNYQTTINGENYSFTSSLEVSDLPPGTYPVCIGLADFTNCEQCFEVVIEEAASLSGQTMVSVDTGKTRVDVDITTGTAPYTVLINNEKVGEYTTNNFSLAVVHGDLVEVFSSLDCEGKLSSKVNLFDEFRIAPNPTKGDITLSVPDSVSAVMNIAIYNSIGVMVSSGMYDMNSGQVVLLPTATLPQGIYLVSIAEGGTFKIVKQ
ncbi:immunoglobulin-like domain-containing protein [Aquimarina sp. AU474]|uniref:immunoglobulin-like domain-containing protein n=1 Tax=Aquimarina sp. AU474 TaxID=2108529 RepID=UPI000D69379F|nr:immunoglobulin-like domain-containing protein [Aquimarina sp. AU474]